MACEIVGTDGGQLSFDDDYMDANNANYFKTVLDTSTTNMASSSQRSLPIGSHRILHVDDQSTTPMSERGNKRSRETFEWVDSSGNGRNATRARHANSISQPKKDDRKTTLSCAECRRCVDVEYLVPVTSGG